MVLGALAPRGLAENELKLSLSMGRKIIEIPNGNQGFWWSWGWWYRAGSQKNELKLSLSMGEEMQGIPQLLCKRMCYVNGCVM